MDAQRQAWCWAEASLGQRKGVGYPALQPPNPNMIASRLPILPTTSGAGLGCEPSACGCAPCALPCGPLANLGTSLAALLTCIINGQAYST